MIAKSMRRFLLVAAIGVCASFAARANAQCCGRGATAYYQPAAYSAYSPVSYTSYYGSNYGTGWYPGYYLDRIRARWWGSPTTYVASYPSTYYASYAPSYTAAYRPAYSVGYSASYAAPAVGCSSCSSCSAGYAPCSSCTTSPCSSCTASYAPSSGCSTCGTAPAVSQAVYQQQPGCASCGKGAAVAPSAPAQPAPQSYSAPTPAPQQGTYRSNDGAPSLDPGASVPTQRPQDTQRPPSNGEMQDVQPEPGSDTNEVNPYDVNSDSSTYFQPPKLFDPNDRTAQRSAAPVTTAVYHKPVSYRQVSTNPITRQQAESDAAGWVSTSR